MNKGLSYGAVVIAIIAIIIAVVGNNQPQEETSLGAIGTRFQHGVSIGTNTSPTSNGLKVGANGTEHSMIKSGFCSPSLGGGAITASSTKAFDCAVTGVLPGDKVFVQATTSATVAEATYYPILGAKASSTAGYISVFFGNRAGGIAGLPGANATDTIPYFILR